MRLIVLFCLAGQLFAASTTRLARQIEAISQATTDGVLGVSAVHIESGVSVSVRGTSAFPMASAVKIPIAVQVMSLVDEGKLPLSKMIDLTPRDLHPGSGRLTDLFFHPGVSISVENLMELMLVISDNTAADLMLREAGGPPAVTARMKALGLNSIRVDRSIALLLADWIGIRDVPPEEEWTREMWDKLENAVPDAQHMRARRAQWNDRRDTATPDDMTKLLVHIWKKDLFSAANADVLLGMMERCQTGKQRIKGMLPAGTPVAHKTGSLGGVVDDIGVITLPDNQGHIAISVFTKAFTKPEETAEKAVAEISRTIYDYFLFQTATN